MGRTELEIKSFKTNIQRCHIQYEPKGKFTHQACYSRYDDRTKFIKIRVIKQPEISEEVTRAYIKQVKKMFNFINYKKINEDIIVTVSQEQLDKNNKDNIEFIFSKIPLFMVRILWESSYQINNVAFIKEFIADKRKFSILKKFTECYNRHLLYTKDLGHGLGGTRAVISVKEMKARKATGVYLSLAVVASKFKTKAI